MAREEVSIRADRGSIAAGQDVIIGLPYDQLPAVLAAARQPWDELSEAQRAVIIGLEGRLGGVAQRAIYGFFLDLGEAEVSLEQLPQRLAEMAEDYKRLKARTTVSPDDLPEVATLKAEADAALDAGERERAETLLTQLRDLKQAAAQKRRAAAETLLAAENRDLLEAAGYEASLGDLAMTRLRYRKASTHFREAAEMVPEPERDTWLGYLDRAAYALLRQGHEFGDNIALEEAVTAFREALKERPRERVPLDWAATQNNLGNALATLGERTRDLVKPAEARKAIEGAFEIFMQAGQEQYRSYFQNRLSELDRRIAELTRPR